MVYFFLYLLLAIYCVTVGIIITTEIGIGD